MTRVCTMCVLCRVERFIFVPEERYLPVLYLQKVVGDEVQDLVFVLNFIDSSRFFMSARLFSGEYRTYARERVTGFSLNTKTPLASKKDAYDT